jgi:hypothetical protein
MSMPDFTYTIHVHEEQASVRGNACSTDDPEEDRAVEQEILGRLVWGDLWAWCTVEVRAHKDGTYGSAYLGCCSYKNGADFRTGGYFEQMQDDAREDWPRRLLDVLADIARAA